MSSSSSMKISSDSSIYRSQSSSSSSEAKGWKAVPFYFECEQSKSILCFMGVGDMLYAGQAYGGKVLYSRDRYHWNTFLTVEDEQVTALGSYSNALFIGTKPKGLIYVYNFSTGRFYEFVQTGDQCVSSFTVFNGNLYAATQPNGAVYCFNGTGWTKSFEMYGHGISTLVAADQYLFAFAIGTETAAMYDGFNWNIMPLQGLQAVGGSQQSTIASFRNVATEPYSNITNSFVDRSKIPGIDLAISNSQLSPQDAALVVPMRPEYYVAAAATEDSELVFCGKDFGEVYQYSSGMLKQITTVREKSVIGVVALSQSQYLVASPHQLYLLNLGEFNGQSSE